LSSKRHEGRLPNYLLAGVQKGGTTAITDYLLRKKTNKGEPSTCLSMNPKHHHLEKEPHFFDSYNRYQNGGIDAYYSIFEHCPENIPIVLDATPNTMPYAKRVYDLYAQQGLANEVKIIFSLREPVSREISWYDHLRRSYQQGETQQYVLNILKPQSTTPRTFAEWSESNIIPGIEKQNPNQFGLYSLSLKKWLELFPRRNILILPYSDFKADPATFLHRLDEFLGLPFTDHEEAPHSNSHHVETDPIPCAVQERLHEYYEPYNQQLYALLEAHKEDAPPMEPQPFPKFEFRCKE